MTDILASLKEFGADPQRFIFSMKTVLNFFPSDTRNCLVK